MRVGTTILSVTALVLSYQACTPTEMRFGRAPSTEATSGGTVTDNPKPTVSVVADPFAPSDSVSLQICTDEIRFRNDKTDFRSRFKAKLIHLDPLGTSIEEQLQIPPGIYNRIELHLAQDCNGSSAWVSNARGIFSVSEEIELRFSGNAPVSTANTQLHLNMSPLLEACSKIKSNEELEETLAKSDGDFDHDKSHDDDND